MVLIVKHIKGGKVSKKKSTGISKKNSGGTGAAAEKIISMEHPELDVITVRGSDKISKKYKELSHRMLDKCIVLLNLQDIEILLYFGAPTVDGETVDSSVVGHTITYTDGMIVYMFICTEPSSPQGLLKTILHECLHCVMNKLLTLYPVTQDENIATAGERLVCSLTNVIYRHIDIDDYIK
jgi:hypothetical protein